MVSSSIMSNCIGAANLPLAKRFFRVICFSFVVALTLLNLCFYLATDQIVAVFTSDPKLRATATPLIVIVASFLAVDGLQIFMQGPIRALGLQRFTCFFAIGSYWLVGVPSAWFLAFYTFLGLKGLLLGYYFAIVIQFAAYLLLLVCTDWEKRVDKLRARAFLAQHSGEQSTQLACDDAK